jgi:hypothetical protein
MEYGDSGRAVSGGSVFSGIARGRLEIVAWGSQKNIAGMLQKRNRCQENTIFAVWAQKSRGSTNMSRRVPSGPALW